MYLYETVEAKNNDNEDNKRNTMLTYNSNMKNDSTRPTKKEQKALRVFLNKFYKLYDEITSNSFMNNSPDLRFYKIKDLFAIYRELLDYELINSYLKLYEERR